MKTKPAPRLRILYSFYLKRATQSLISEAHGSLPPKFVHFIPQANPNEQHG